VRSFARVASDHDYEQHVRDIDAGTLLANVCEAHQLHLGTLQLIVRPFLTVFANAGAYLSTFSFETPILALDDPGRIFGWLVNQPRDHGGAAGSGSSMPGPSLETRAPVAKASAAAEVRTCAWTRATSARACASAV
jgi:hypothetical protein